MTRFVRMPTAAEERALIARAQSGDEEAMEALLFAQEYVIRKLVTKAARHYISFAPEDLMQMGRLGVVTAVKKFDLSKNLRLSTYACLWIRAKLNLALREDGLIRLPAHVIENTPRDERGQLPRADLSLDVYVGTDEDATLGDLLPGGPSAEEEALRRSEIREAQETLEALLACLTPTERKTICLFFGLDGHGKRTLQEVADILGASREGIRQRTDRALRKMKFASQHGGQLPLPIDPQREARKEEILRRRAAGDTCHKIAGDLAISSATVWGYLKRAGETG